MTKRGTVSRAGAAAIMLMLFLGLGAVLYGIYHADDDMTLSLSDGPSTLVVEQTPGIALYGITVILALAFVGWLVPTVFAGMHPPRGGGRRARKAYLRNMGFLLLVALFQGILLAVFISIVYSSSGRMSIDRQERLIVVDRRSTRVTMPLDGVVCCHAIQESRGRTRFLVVYAIMKEHPDGVGTRLPWSREHGLELMCHRVASPERADERMVRINRWIAGAGIPLRCGSD